MQISKKFVVEFVKKDEHGFTLNTYYFYLAVFLEHLFKITAKY